MALLDPQLQGGVINLREAAPQLTSLLATEPTWLAAVYQQQQSPSDTEMCSCLAKARGANPQFTMRTVHGFELCYRVNGSHL